MIRGIQDDASLTRARALAEREHILTQRTRRGLFDSAGETFHARTHFYLSIHQTWSARLELVQRGILVGEVAHENGGVERLPGH
jgi:hypothetical protein